MQLRLGIQTHAACRASRAGGPNVPWQGALLRRQGCCRGCCRGAAGGAAAAVGWGACSTGLAALTFGYATSSTGDYSINITQSGSSTAACSIAIGGGASSTHAGAVALGHNITTERANTTHVQSLVAYGQGASKIYDLGNWATATQTVNWDEGNNQKVTIDASVTTLTLSNPIAGANYMIQITQGGVGSYTVTWPASVYWANATPPTLSTAVGKIDVISLFYDGTNYLSTFLLNFA